MYNVRDNPETVLNRLREREVSISANHFRFVHADRRDLIELLQRPAQTLHTHAAFDIVGM